MSAEVGSTFGRYRLLRLIASDAVTQTFFATLEGGAPRSRSASAQFAVRIARPVDMGDPNAVETAQRVLSRAQHAGVVDHPAIVRPHDLGIVNGQPFVATPFVRAVPLRDLLRHGGTINESAALAMFAQLAGALDVAHRAGVVHGALSPCTIWVGPSAGEGVAYVAYLTGFDVNPLLHDHLVAEPRGAPIDDILYVAPEQLRAGPVTGYSDQYALACALYHTLAGQPPFERKSRSKLYGAHLLAPAPALRDQDPGISPATSDALQRAMSKQPADRFPSCGLLIHEALPNEPGTAALAAAPRRSRRRRPARVTRSRSRWPLALAAIAVVLAGLALWVIAGPGRQSDAAGPLTQSLSAQAPAQPVATSSATVATSDSRTRWTAAVADQQIRRIDVLEGAIAAVTDAGVVVVEPADGAVRWRHPLAGPQSSAAHGGVIAAVDQRLIALDVATGAVRWRSGAIGVQPSVGLTSQAIVGVGGTPSAPELVAVAADDGAELWHAHNEAAAATAITIAATDQLTYALRGATLWTVDPATATAVEPGRRHVVPLWREDVEDPWPVLTAITDGVVMATRNGEVCRYAAADGAEQWCAAVPGVVVEQPRLLRSNGAVVAATSKAIVALDETSGETSWSVSPGSPGNVVAVGQGSVAFADDAAVWVLNADAGDVTRELSDLADVTALALTDATLLAGTADGAVHSVDLARGG